MGCWGFVLTFYYFLVNIGRFVLTFAPFVLSLSCEAVKGEGYGGAKVGIVLGNASFFVTDVTVVTVAVNNE